MELNEIIELCLKGNRKGQLLLYRYCYVYLMSICYRYIKNEEERVSVINICMMQILTNLDKYNITFPFFSWVKKIMINTIINEYRKNKRYNEYIDIKDTDDYKNNYFEQDDFRYDTEWIEEIIDTLPDTYKKVFMLYVVDGYKHQEISELLKFSENTSKWYLSEARKLLQKKISTLNSYEKFK